jgi:hypothetical protein
LRHPLSIVISHRFPAQTEEGIRNSNLPATEKEEALYSNVKLVQQFAAFASTRSAKLADVAPYQPDLQSAAVTAENVAAISQKYLNSRYVFLPGLPLSVANRLGLEGAEQARFAKEQRKRHLDLADSLIVLNE